MITFQKEAQEVLINKGATGDSKDQEEVEGGHEAKMEVTSQKEGAEKEERSCQQILCQSCQVNLIQIFCVHKIILVEFNFLGSYKRFFHRRCYLFYANYVKTYSITVLQYCNVKCHVISHKNKNRPKATAEKVNTH